MKKIVRLIFLMMLTVIMSACAKHPPAPVSTLNAMPTNVPQMNQSSNKFAFGPHSGLLGVRQFYFNCSSSLLPTYYYKALQAHAKYLQQHPDLKIQAQGFTTAAGSPEYNITVGERRADAVSSYLQLQGASKAQISAVSYGAELDKPYAGHKNTKNCRVDLVYL